VFINNIPNVVTAVGIWASATRTLTVDPAGGQLQNVAWAHSPRTLGTWSFIYSEQGVAYTSIASGTSVDLRAPVSYVRFITCVLDSGLVNLEAYDGTNATKFNTGANSTNVRCFISGNGTGLRINNTDGSAHNYMYDFYKFNLG